MAIITISRQIGSLGNEIGKELSAKLGYERIEKSRVYAILSEHGFSAADVDKFDEKNPSLLQHLSNQKHLYEHLIRAAVYEFAAKGNVVMIGRGAQVILQDIPGTLHVRVVAPYATRLKRLMNKTGSDEKNAQWTIQQSDRHSSGYIHSYFNADWNDSELYDLVLNTRTMTLNSCVEMIRSAVCSAEFEKSVPAPETLIDRALTEKAKAVIMEINGIEKADLVVKNGTVYLSGADLPLEVRQTCEKALFKVKGIKSFTQSD